MHHYPHHIADFNNATRHLSREERGMYRDMLDLYYDTEKPLNSDVEELCRRLLADSEQLFVCVQRVLKEFFILTEDGYTNERCETVICAYQTSIKNKSKAGRASGNARKAKNNKRKSNKTNSRSTGVEQVLDSVEQVFTTNNHNQEPITITNRLNNIEKENMIKEKFGADALTAFEIWLQDTGEPEDHNLELIRDDSIPAMVLLDSGCTLENLAWIIQGEISDADRTKSKRPSLGQICTKTINASCDKDFRQSFDSMIKELIYDFAPLTE